MVMLTDVIVVVVVVVVVVVTAVAVAAAAAAVAVKYDRMGEKRTIIIIIHHELGLDRLVSASSHILSKFRQVVFVHLLYDSAQRHKCSIIPCGNTPVQRLKVTTPPLNYLVVASNSP
jgi:hypothetical protein